MLHVQPSQRPTAQKVVDRCSEFINNNKFLSSLHFKNDALETRLKQLEEENDKLRRYMR